jgi:hypothetical protein
MFTSQIKAGAISAIALAMTVGLAAPASAVTLTADVTSVSPGESVMFETDAQGQKLSAVFIEGDFWGSGPVNTTPNPFGWDLVSPCVTVEMTYRVYDEDGDFFAENREVAFSEQPVDSVSVEFVGDNSGECDDTWGTGESNEPNEPAERLAKTGSDASAVAGLTGAAGVAALAVAAAVALRTRRAQR